MEGHRTVRLAAQELLHPGRFGLPHLVRAAGADELGDLLARRLVGIGRPRRQLVRSAMDVRVLVRVEVVRYPRST